MIINGWKLSKLCPFHSANKLPAQKAPLMSSDITFIKRAAKSLLQISKHNSRHQVILQTIKRIDLAIDQDYVQRLRRHFEKSLYHLYICLG